MIFINIAATYTPVCMIALKNNLGWTLLFIIWSIALAGILIKIFWIHAPRWLSTTIYVLMGWMAIVVIIPLIEVLQVQALVWLFIGGVFFTTGAIIYALKKPDPYPGILGFHEIFHLFVLLGSFSHFWMMYKYIAILN
jgi:hemolysin III